MLKISGVIVISFLALTGCVPKKSSQYAASQRTQAQASIESAIEEATAGHSSEEPRVLNGNSGSVQQCRKELDAIRLYNEGLYQRYLNEFQQTGQETKKYLAVKDTLGADINNLAMPHYQFQIRELCFRVKTHLARLMINQEK
ncbi:hypothetical protein [[Erwinia] mediterraneensis]|uniref:hypothetical protein n=1 Tax=[Erwinia] mediterraneensis TaxID=2161819 RepID=UPI001F431EC9|nr:hypothetical protein [[Erwinia] mediterraneensis]